MITDTNREDSDQYVACKRLLAAVVGLAVTDACIHPGKYSIGDVARSAMDFIFKHSDGYLELLDINPKQFRERLVNLSYDTSVRVKAPYNLTADELRKFRINYQLWLKSKGKQAEVEKYYG